MKLDPISVPPTIRTPHARAWKLDATALRRKVGDESPHAIVAVWLIEARWAHSIWHSYLLSVVHLRDLEGQPPPVLYRPDATHELVLEALNPEHPRQAIFEGLAIGRLTPVNFAAQLAVQDDAAAEAKALDAVTLISKALLSPDTDFRQQWINLFGDNMMRK